MENKSKLTGQRISDRIAKSIRTWYFVAFQLTFIITWIFLNSLNITNMDPYPFEILKLILTAEGLFMISMILMHQARQSDLHRKIVYQDFVLDKSIKEKVDEIYRILKNK